LARTFKPDDSLYYDWRDFQVLLREVGNRKVTVPFSDALAHLIPPRATRLRRDFAQIITAIKAHAFIHCYRRSQNERGELVADLDLDYVPVADLVGHIAAEGAGIAVSKELLETIEAVSIITSDTNMPPDDGATAHQVGKLLKLDAKSSDWRRLGVAMDKGFVVNMETHKGSTGSPSRRSRSKRCCHRRRR
jgi:hypothetical protein